MISLVALTVSTVHESLSFRRFIQTVLNIFTLYRVIWGNMDRLSIVSIILTPVSSLDYFVVCLQKDIHINIFLFALYFLTYS